MAAYACTVRVNVKGISGSGKSTFSRELAERLGVPYLELDAIHHGPNWNEASGEELQSRVREFMAGAPDGWVIDGNYESKLGDLVRSRGPDRLARSASAGCVAATLAAHPDADPRQGRALERQP